MHVSITYFICQKQYLVSHGCYANKNFLFSFAESTILGLKVPKISLT